MIVFSGRRLGRREWLAWYNIAAGVTGIALTTYNMGRMLVQVPAGRWPIVLLVFLFVAGCFGAVALGGWQLFRTSSRPPKLLLAGLLLQLPVFSVYGLQWAFVAGGYATTTWTELGRWFANAGVQAASTLSWGASGPTYVGINLVPLAILGLLRNADRRFRHHEAAMTEVSAAPEAHVR